MRWAISGSEDCVQHIRSQQILPLNRFEPVSDCGRLSPFQNSVPAISLPGGASRNGRSDATVLRAAVVLQNERTFARGVTNLARNVFWAVGSSVAGLIMQNLAFSAPLVIGGGMKVTYDLTLSRVFRKLRPPEELKRNAKLLA